MEPLVSFLKFERETKGSVLYKAEAPGYPVRSEYVDKAQLPRPFPTRIKITVEDASK